MIWCFSPTPPAYSSAVFFPQPRSLTAHEITLLFISCLDGRPQKVGGEVTSRPSHFIANVPAYYVADLWWMPCLQSAASLSGGWEEAAAHTSQLPGHVHIHAPLVALPSSIPQLCCRSMTFNLRGNSCWREPSSRQVHESTHLWLLLTSRGDRALKSQQKSGSVAIGSFGCGRWPGLLLAKPLHNTDEA